MAIVLETTIGDMTIDLFTDVRPMTQSGDPSGSGNGGESVFSFVKGPDAKYITGEKLPKLKHTKPGLVSMVNCGNHLIGSQFFITLGQDLDSLNEHIIFGEIAEGHEVLLKLNETICDLENHPYQDIRITHTVILEDPFDDIEGLHFPPNSPEPTEEILKTNRIAADEEIHDESKCSAIQLQELKAEQEAKAQATILEIVGDIPDADIAPPENVLFVCKLNPVTTDEDLEIIFGRFGKINSCEVIRDKDSGDSLQYAFIEFDERKSCEDAYLKMDNVLIDDRRIHVDFSQSVAKMRWRGKGRGVEYFNKNSKSKENSDNRAGRRSESSKYDRKESRNYQSKEKRRSSKSPERSRRSSKSPDRSRRSSKSPERSRRSSKSPIRLRRSSESLERSRRRSRSRDRQKQKDKTRYKSRSRSRHRGRSRSRHRSKSRSRSYSRSRRKYHDSSRSRNSRNSHDYYSKRYSRR